MNKVFLLSLIVAFAWGCSQPEIKLHYTVTEPEKMGLNSKVLNQINPVMQKYIDDKKLSGMITMVARHGEIVNFESYGFRNKNKPMQLNTIFRIASMTKPITSVAIMILYDEGRFQLDDPVAKYIPEFNNLKVLSSIDKNGIHVVDQLRLMTIRDLLTHTSGLASGGENTPVDSMYRAANLSGGTLKDMIKKLANIPLLYQPGTRWNYSRSTDVLAYLVEVISGNPFDVFLKERIFIPLKMKDTEFYVPKEKIKRVAAVYTLARSGGIKSFNPDRGNISKQVKFLSGNGGLYSTATDYMIFSQLLLNKGVYDSVRLLKKNTVELMTSNQTSNVIMPNDNFFGPLLSGMGYGLGFAVLKENNPSNSIGSAGSYWWAGSANTYFYIDPQKDLILIFMTQFVPNFYYPVCKEFRELVYNSIVE
jgi:CubicO group peptidase (beta-lactamase class C family)